MSVTLQYMWVIGLLPSARPQSIRINPIIILRGWVLLASSFMVYRERSLALLVIPLNPLPLTALWLLDAILLPVYVQCIDKQDHF